MTLVTDKFRCYGKLDQPTMKENGGWVVIARTCPFIYVSQVPTSFKKNRPSPFFFLLVLPQVESGWNPRGHSLYIDISGSTFSLPLGAIICGASS